MWQPIVLSCFFVSYGRLLVLGQQAGSYQYGGSSSSTTGHRRGEATVRQACGVFSTYIWQPNLMNALCVQATESRPRLGKRIVLLMSCLISLRPVCCALLLEFGL